MSTYLGPNEPNPVKDGLICYLDAQNSLSYSGSGSVWNNLVGLSNADLLNTPTYVTTPNPSFSLDGVNEYIVTSGLANVMTTAQKEGELTYEYWLKPTGSITAGLTQSNTGALFYTSTDIPQGLGGDLGYGTSSTYVGFGFAMGVNGFLLGVHKTDYAPIILVDYRNLIGIQHLVVIKSINNCSYYINGELMKTSLTIAGGATIIGDTFKNVTARTNAFTTYFSGEIYVSRFYTRRLTDSEIIRNYNCEKYRYI